MADSKLELLIDIRSRLDELTKASAEMAKFRQETTSAGQALRTGFGVDIARRGIELLTNSVRDFALQAFQIADQIEDTSRNLGLSIEAYQVLARTVRDAGGDISLLSMAVANSNRSMGEARQLGSAAASAYRQLGLDVAKLESMPVERRFEAIAKAIANSEDQLSAYSAASQILGSRNLPTLLGALKDLAADGYDNVAKAAQRAGQVMEADTVRRLKEAKKAIEDLKNATTIAVGGEIGTIMRAWQKDGFMGMLRYGASFMSPFPRSAVLGQYAAPAEATLPPANDAKARQDEQNRRILALARANASNAALLRQSIVTDPTIDEFERKKALIPALEKEIALRQELAAAIEAAPLDNQDELGRSQELFKILEETLRLQKDLRALKSEGTVDKMLNEFFGPFDAASNSPSRLSEAARRHAGMNDIGRNPEYMTSGEGALAGAGEWVADLGSRGQQVADLMRNTIGAAVDAISDGIYGWITGTMTFGEAMMNLGATILRMILQTIVQMGVQMLVNAVIGRALQAAASAAAIATALATAGPLSAVWAGPATLATIATMGTAAAQAPASIALAKATVLGTSVAGFSTGGYTGDMARDQVAGVVHGQEFVLNAAATRSLGVGFLDQVNRLGAIPASAPVAPVSASAPLLAGGSLGGLGGRETARNTHVYLDRSAWLDAVRADLSAIAHEIYDQRSRA